MVVAMMVVGVERAVCSYWGMWGVCVHADCNGDIPGYLFEGVSLPWPKLAVSPWHRGGLRMEPKMARAPYTRLVLVVARRALVAPRRVVVVDAKRAPCRSRVQRAVAPRHGIVL